VDIDFPPREALGTVSHLACRFGGGKKGWKRPFFGNSDSKKVIPL
jgi:hypothetical protein